MFPTRWRRMLISAALGAVVFGSWAYFANFNAEAHRLNSAIAQATFSFFFSFIVVGLAELLFHLLDGRPHQVALSIALPWASSVTGGYLVHHAAHTPSLGLTILGPAAAGLAFGTAYVLRLKRVRRLATRRQRDFTRPADTGDT